MSWLCGRWLQCVDMCGSQGILVGPKFDHLDERTSTAVSRLHGMHVQDKDAERGSPRSLANLYAGQRCGEGGHGCFGLKHAKCMGGLAVFVVFSVLASVILAPKEPTWEVMDLALTHVGLPDDDVDGPGVVEMGFEAVVRVYNPNLIGAVTEPGTFSVLYEGTVIGAASMRALQIGGRGSVTVPVIVSVDGVSADMGMDMLKELATHGGQLTTECTGSVIAKVGMLRVRCLTMCRLTSDVSTMPAFSRKECSYSYGV